MVGGAASVVEVTHGLTGAAVWHPPAAPAPPAHPAGAAVGEGPIPGTRLRPEVTEALARIAAAAPAESHWYLAVLGAPVAGSGAGSALLRARLAELDGAGHAAALSTGTEANVGWYRRFGFVGIAAVAAGPLTARWMWRPAS